VYPKLLGVTEAAADPESVSEPSHERDGNFSTGSYDSPTPVMDLG